MAGDINEILRGIKPLKDDEMSAILEAVAGDSPGVYEWLYDTAIETNSRLAAVLWAVMTVQSREKDLLREIARGDDN